MASKTIRVGDTVELKGQRIGLVRFKGRTQFAKGEWYGIELYNSHSRHDGIIMQKRYFRSPRNRGLFVRRQIIVNIVPQAVANKQLRVFQRAGLGSSAKGGMKTYMNRISGFASTMPKGYQPAPVRTARSQEPPTTIKEENSAGKRKRAQTGPNNDDTAVGSHIKSTQSVAVLGLNSRNNNNDNDDSKTVSSTLTGNEASDDDKHDKNNKSKSQPPHGKKNDKNSKNDRGPKGGGPGTARLRASKSTNPSDSSSNNKKSGRGAKNKGSSVEATSTMDIPKLHAVSKSNPNVKSPKSILKNRADSKGNKKTSKGNKKGKAGSRAGSRKNTIENDGDTDAEELDSIGDLPMSPKKPDKKTSAGRRMIRKRRERMMSIEVSSVEATATIINGNDGNASSSSRDSDDGDTNVVTLGNTNSNSKRQRAHTDETRNNNDKQEIKNTKRKTTDGSPRKNRTTRTTSPKKRGSGVRKSSAAGGSGSNHNSGGGGSGGLSSPRAKPKISLQTPIHTQSIHEPGLLSPTTPKEMANTHPSMSNLESFSHHTHRVSYGMDPVFTRLDRRRQRTSDVLLLQNPKPKVVTNSGRDEDDEDEEEDDDESNNITNSNKNNSTKKGKNGKNKKPKLKNKASNSKKEEKLKLRRKFSTTTKRMEAKAQREYFAKRGRTSSRETKEKQKEKEKEKKKKEKKEKEKKEKDKNNKKASKGIKSMMNKGLGAIDDELPQLDIGSTTESDESPGEGNRVQFSKSDSVVVKDVPIENENENDNDANNEKKIDKAMKLTTKNIKSDEKQQENKSDNSNSFPKVELMDEQEIMRKLSTIFLENQSDLKSKLRKVTKKTKSNENTIR